MSVLSNIESIWQKDETWVLGFIQTIKTGVVAAENDMLAFWTWLSAHAGEISQDALAITGAVNTLQAAGVPVPQGVYTAMSAMNAAVSGLNASVTSAAGGASSVSVVVAGYTAAKQAESAHAQAAVAVVNAPVPVKAP
jgi:hypothetical protein